MKVLAAVVFFFVAVARVFSQESLAWLPITEKDWAAGVDSAKGIHNAAMLFERVFADESNPTNGCVLRVYRRVRILASEGRSWADVSIAYDPDTDEIKHVSGRTILPDGSSFQLEKKSILEKQSIKTEEYEEKQIFFSLPGVTDNCIVEYSYERESEATTSSWVAQKDIPVLEWEYRWKFYKTKFWQTQPLYLYQHASGSSPNYVWVNSAQPLSLSWLPSEQEPEEVTFRLANIPGFQPEPYSLPDEALKANLRLFYSSPDNATSFWSSVSVEMQDWLDSFCERHDRVDDLAEKISALPTPQDRADSARRWILANIKNNSSDRRRGEYDENKSADDVLKHAYGSDIEINALYCSLLQQLKMRSRLLLVPDRSRRRFYEIAKYWQFDGTAVAVIDSGGNITYESPGEPGTASHQLPWYYEGSLALVIGTTFGDRLFYTLPNSTPTQNVSRSEATTAFLPEEQARDTVLEAHTGQEARRLRALLHGKSSADGLAAIKKDLASDLTEGWKDSIRVLGVDLRGDTVSFRYVVDGPPLEPSADGRYLFKPFSFLPPRINPFTRDVRRYPISLKYACMSLKQVDISLPEKLRLEVLPQPIHFKNAAGSIDYIVSQTEKGILVQVKETIRQGMFESKFYPQVKEYADQLNGASNMTLILKQVP